MLLVAGRGPDVLDELLRDDPQGGPVADQHDRAASRVTLAQVGDEVFPLGHPLGLTQSLSGGVVSALDRSISVRSGQTLEGLIQFDAAVNPGNSGGPLLNRDGQVIGIVTGLANPSEQNFFVGIGFAVPIATAGGVAGSPPQ